MEDLISRSEAIEALKGLPTWWADEGGYYGGAQPPMEALLDPTDAVSAIENLPSAQPERMSVNLRVEKISKHQSDFSDLDAEPEQRLSCKNCIHLGHGYMMPCKNCKRNQMLPDWYEVETERKKND